MRINTKVEKETNAMCGTVVDHIIDQVARKEYNVGDRLPPERELSIQLNVSRATAREALKVLNYLGFIETQQGSGNYITDDYNKTTANIMKVMYLRGDVDFEGFTEFRKMLELHSFELALKNATEKQKKEMEQIVNLLDLTTDSTLIVTLDNHFHTLLVEASGNPLMIINYSALSIAITEYMSETFRDTVSKKESGFEKLQEYHHAIIDALISKDRKKGRQAIIDHFNLLH